MVGEFLNTGGECELESRERSQGRSRTEIGECKTDLIRTLIEKLIQFVIRCSRFGTANELIEVREVLMHPDVNELILHVADVYAPRTGMNETRCRVLVDDLLGIVAIDGFVITLKCISHRPAAREGERYHGTWFDGVMLKFEHILGIGERIRVSIGRFFDWFDANGFSSVRTIVFCNRG